MSQNMICAQSRIIAIRLQQSMQEHGIEDAESAQLFVLSAVLFTSLCVIVSLFVLLSSLRKLNFVPYVCYSLLSYLFFL